MLAFGRALAILVLGALAVLGGRRGTGRRR